LSGLCLVVNLSVISHPLSSLLKPLAVHPRVGLDCCIVITHTLRPVAEQYMFTLHKFYMLFVICFPSYITLKLL